MTSARGKSPENPLTVLRTTKRLSQEALAKKAGVSRQLIIRAEQAVYASPPPALVSTLLDISDPAAVGFALDEETVYHLYKEYQTHVRKRSFGRLATNQVFSDVPKGVHPFVDWRLRSGIKARIGPAKFFCVHPALLHKFEVQPHLCQSPPGDLLHALVESGYSKELLASFSLAYDTYKGHLREEFRRKQSNE